MRIRSILGALAVALVAPGLANADAMADIKAKGTLVVGTKAD